ncbi:MAG: LysR family transcriptional regulator [Halieaceae bacterium]|nr:LysR family transcriptional regulator [Halieaceae bacterium]
MDPGHKIAESAARHPAQIAWDLDWNLLRTFMVIARFKSITGAANYLNLKQPTVSNALRRLETQLGFQLAERGPRNFTVTHHGEALYRQCEEIFGSIGRLPNIVQDSHDNVEGHIRIVMASHVITPMLDATLLEFHQKNPRATFSISIKDSQEVIETIRAKQATLGVCLIREPVPDLAVDLFYREHFGFFCGRPHPLFGKKICKLDELKGQQIVSFYTDKLGDVLHQVAVLRGQSQLSDTITGLSNNLEEVRRMIMAGLGIGPLPVHVVERDIANGQLWRLAVDETPVAVDVFTLQNQGAILNAAEKEFLLALQRTVNSTDIQQRSYGLTDQYPVETG